jgi:hypothetical protein
MATVATNAEKEEKASVREERGENDRVLTVRGSRDRISRNCENREEDLSGAVLRVSGVEVGGTDTKQESGRDLL